jgi:hypothetical protein
LSLGLWRKINLGYLYGMVREKIRRKWKLRMRQSLANERRDLQKFKRLGKARVAIGQ